MRPLLQDRAFRGMWMASSAYCMVAVAAWMVVELTASSFMAALVQTAVLLPLFVLALPAGVVAHTMARRRLLLITLVVQVVGIVLLFLALLGGFAGAATVLFMTFLAGCCTAVMSPAWNAMVGEMRPREALAPLLRAATFGGTGSALWALLPVIGLQNLGLGAEGVGFFIGALRERLGMERLVVGAGLLFGLVMLVAALSRLHALVYAAPCSRPLNPTRPSTPSDQVARIAQHAAKWGC